MVGFFVAYRQGLMCVRKYGNLRALLGLITIPSGVWFGAVGPTSGDMRCMTSSTSTVARGYEGWGV